MSLMMLTVSASAVALAVLIQTPAVVTPPAAPPPVTETVVVTGVAAPTPPDGVGRTVVALKGDEAREVGIVAATDVLRLVPGVDVRARGVLGVQSDFSLRGATFGQALVLVDGIRLNNSQSGHHNSDVPIGMSSLARVEVAQGPTSGVHGADAVGGTVHFLTRRDPHALVTMLAGQFGLAGVDGSMAGHGLPENMTAAFWAARSSGFMFDREFWKAGGLVRRAPVAGITIDARHERKAFGANGFYGPSPSFEWTNQTILGAAWTGARGAWTTQATGLARRHADHFRWDIFRPGVAENRHRSQAVEGGLVVRHDAADGRRITLGGGASEDWIRSNNLGDRQYARQHALAELQAPVAGRLLASAGVRVDHYTEFGTAWSPSAWLSGPVAGTLRFRVSAARAFRVPSFTERYYRDPANQARADLRPERGHGVDGGLDWTGGGWSARVTASARWDEDVIDWVRESPQHVWRTTNVRDVRTRSLEVSAAHRWAGARLGVSYAYLAVEAPAISLLSKYVLEYAPHAFGVQVSAPLVGRIRAGATVDARRRFGGERYALVGLQLSAPVGWSELFVAGSNLLNQQYREIAGVPMPGRWMWVGLRLRPQR